MRSESKQGLVSIIIPTFNRADLITQSLDSVYSQTYRPIELIVIDDGSTDNTKEIIMHWRVERERSMDFKINYIYQKNNGPASARNYGLVESKGEYIQFLDSDDILCKDKISAQVKALSANPHYQVAYCAWRTLFDSSLIKYSPYHQRIAVQSEDIMLKGYLSDTWFLPHHSYLFTRTSVINSGFWDTNIFLQDDTDYLIRMLLLGTRFIYVPGVFVDYRRHLSKHVSASAGLASSLKVKEKAYLFLENKGISEHYYNDFRKWYQNLLNKAAISDYRVNTEALDDSFKRFLNNFSISSNIGRTRILMNRIAHLFVVRFLRQIVVDAVLVRFMNEGFRSDGKAGDRVNNDR